MSSPATRLGLRPLTWGWLECKAGGALGDTINVLKAREGDVERHGLWPKRLRVRELQESL